MADENLAKPYYTVLILAFVCSALVAGAAVGLRPLQEKNKSLDQKKHILYAANLYDPEVSIDPWSLRRVIGLPAVRIWQKLDIVSVFPLSI